MFDALLFGLFLGWGAAIPIGAINLEIIRRNLRFSTASGLAFGLGACMADVTYLVLLSIGILQFLNYPLVLKITGIVGSLILAWFGWTALRQKPVTDSDDTTVLMPSYSLLKHARESYLLTLINPFNIIFWSSVSALIATKTQTEYATLYAGAGVLLGTFSWVCGLNLLLHFTRHRLSVQTIHKMNMAGGILLLGFAFFGLVNSIL